MRISLSDDCYQVENETKDFSSAMKSDGHYDLAKLTNLIEIQQNMTMLDRLKDLEVTFHSIDIAARNSDDRYMRTIIRNIGEKLLYLYTLQKSTYNKE